MVGDRRSCLKLHARALGVLREDVDGGGPVPHFHKQLALDYAQRDLNQRLLESQIQVALHNFNQAGSQGKQQAADQINDLVKKLQRALVPWAAGEQSKSRKPIDPKDAKDIQKRWDQAFGGEDNPKVQEKLQKLQETLKKSRGEAIKSLDWVRRI